MELTFVKNNSGHAATGKAGKFLLVPPVSPSGQWLVKCGSEVITKVKGFANAQKAAQTFETDNQPVAEPVKTTSTRNRAVSSTVTTVNGKAANVATPAIPAVRSNGRKLVAPKEFPDHETWFAETQEPKGKRETAATFADRKKSTRLKWGKERAAYNRANGIESATPAKSATVPKEPKVIEPTLTREELYGEVWNNWGDIDYVAYEMSRLVNAYASRDYSIEHGKVHPHSGIAQNSYYKAVERCYLSEQRLVMVCNSRGLTIPKDFVPEYDGKTLAEVDELEQPVLAGYIDFYANALHIVDEKNPANEDKMRKEYLKTFTPESLKLYPLVSVTRKPAATTRNGRRK